MSRFRGWCGGLGLSGGYCRGGERKGWEDEMS